MTKGKKTRIFLLLALAALIVIQFFQIDRNNSTVGTDQDFINVHGIPENVASKLRNACYDCHGDNTQYPWYTYIQPVGWWVKGHVDHGKGKLNFSRWSAYDMEKKKHKLEECIEEVEARHMPLKSYTWMHPKAKLSDEDRELLVGYFKRIEVY